MQAALRDQRAETQQSEMEKLRASMNQRPSTTLTAPTSTPLPQEGKNAPQVVPLSTPSPQGKNAPQVVPLFDVEKFAASVKSGSATASCAAPVVESPSQATEAKPRQSLQEKLPVHWKTSTEKKPDGQQKNHPSFWDKPRRRPKGQKMNQFSSNGRNEADQRIVLNWTQQKKQKKKKNEASGRKARMQQPKPWVPHPTTHLARGGNPKQKEKSHRWTCNKAHPLRIKVKPQRSRNKVKLRSELQQRMNPKKPPRTLQKWRLRLLNQRPLTTRYLPRRKRRSRWDKKAACRLKRRKPTSARERNINERRRPSRAQQKRKNRPHASRQRNKVHVCRWDNGRPPESNLQPNVNPMSDDLHLASRDKVFWWTVLRASRNRHGPLADFNSSAHFFFPGEDVASNRATRQ